MYKESAEKVQPVVDHVISQIQDVANRVDEAVLEFIVRFQEITDAAIQEASQPAADLGHGPDGKNGDDSLLSKTNKISGSFAQSIEESSELKMDNVLSLC